MKSRSIVKMCNESLNALGSVNRVSLAWMPNHSGVEGNEETDRLAKLGSVTGRDTFQEVLPGAS